MSAFRLLVVAVSLVFFGVHNCSASPIGVNAVSSGCTTLSPHSDTSDMLVVSPAVRFAREDFTGLGETIDCTLAEQVFAFTSPARGGGRMVSDILTIDPITFHFFSDAEASLPFPPAPQATRDIFREDTGSKKVLSLFSILVCSDRGDEGVGSPHLPTCLLREGADSDALVIRGSGPARGIRLVGTLNERDEGNGKTTIDLTVPMQEFNFCSEIPTEADVPPQAARPRICAALSDYLVVEPFQIHYQSNVEHPLNSSAKRVAGEVIEINPFRFSAISDTDVPEPSTLALLLILLVPLTVARIVLHRRLPGSPRAASSASPGIVASLLLFMAHTATASPMYMYTVVPDKTLITINEGKVGLVHYMFKNLGTEPIYVFTFGLSASRPIQPDPTDRAGAHYFGADASLGIAG